MRFSSLPSFSYFGYISGFTHFTMLVYDRINIYASVVCLLARDT